ncbi:MAG TPA: hypothetical protein VD969_07585 [Symbiobacteriaceae bacterium]|nr:hypothetical protein [Symbiobacteriaceae bacterium]
MIRIPLLELLRRKKQRIIVIVAGRIAEINPDDQDTEGVLHQIFTIRIDEVREDLKHSGAAVGQIVTIAIRFGDGAGMHEPIPGLAAGAPIEVCGVYVRAEDAYAQPDGEQNPVIHFTHRPLGWVTYDGHRYS